MSHYTFDVIQRADTYLKIVAGKKCVFTFWFKTRNRRLCCNASSIKKRKAKMHTEKHDGFVLVYSNKTVEYRDGQEMRNQMPHTLFTLRTAVVMGNALPYPPSPVRGMPACGASRGTAQTAQYSSTLCQNIV